MTKVPTIGNLEAALKAVVPPGSDVEVVVTKRGAFDVTVRLPDGPILRMQGLPRRKQYGVTPDMRSVDAGFDDGHPPVFRDYEPAIRKLIAHAAGPPRDD
jgi:hypothetical protein